MVGWCCRGQHRTWTAQWQIVWKQEITGSYTPPAIPARWLTRPRSVLCTTARLAPHTELEMRWESARIAIACLFCTPGTLQFCCLLCLFSVMHAFATLGAA